MVAESTRRTITPSNFSGRKTAPGKSLPPNARDRISFRDLARVAAPRKTKEFLVARTGCDDSTAKRWLRGKSRVPGQAVYAVLADIFTRID
jgi:hypothetical protein